MQLTNEQLAIATRMAREAQERINTLPYGEAAELNPAMYAVRDILAHRRCSALRHYAMLDEQAPRAIRQVVLDICLATGLMSSAEVPTGAPFANYFEVAAGKYDAHAKNYKYIDKFTDFAKALHAFRACDDYHFSELHYVDYNGHRFDVELHFIK